MNDESLPKFPSREWVEMMKKKSSNKEDSISPQVRVSEDPNKSIIRFLLSERNKFVNSR